MKKTLFVILISFLTACSTIPVSSVSGTQYGLVKSANPKEVIFIHGMFLTAKGWL